MIHVISYLGALLFFTNCIGVMPSTHVFSFPHARSLSYEDVVHSSYVFITTPSAVPVLVSIRLSDMSYNNSTMISSTGHANFTLPTSAILGEATGKYDRTVIVTSEADIMVYGMCAERQSSDGFSVLAVDQLDDEYYIASYTPVAPKDQDGTTPYSEVSVSAIGQETDVTITNLEGNILTHITLQGYESYQLLSEEDLTGFKIMATNPVSVMAGSNCAWIPFDQYEALQYSGNCAYIMEHIPGVNGLGQEFVLAPFEGRKLGYVYRVIATMDDTTVTTMAGDGVTSRTLDSKAFYEDNSNSACEVIVIETNKPVLVAQYSKDRHTEVDYETVAGNPSMVIVTPTSEYKSSALIPVTSLSTAKPQTTYINVIVNCDQKNDITMPALTDVSCMSFDEKFCVLSGSVAAPALYTITIPSPGVFTAQVYGFARYAAYSYQVSGYNEVTNPSTINPLVTDEADHSTTKVPDGAVPSTTKTPDVAEPSTTKLSDGVEPSTTKTPDGAEPSTTKLSDGAEPSTTKLTDGADPSTTKQPDGAEPSTTKLPNGAEPSNSMVTDGSGSLTNNPHLFIYLWGLLWFARLYLG